MNDQSTSLLRQFLLKGVKNIHDRLSGTDSMIEKQRQLSHFRDFMAGLAHGILQPTSKINIRLFILEKVLKEGTPEYEDVQVIRTEICRLARTMQELFHLVRGGEPHLTAMNPEAALKPVHDLFAASLEKQSIKLTLDSMVPAQFHADPQQIKQVLINLIKNAAESIEHDGTITLRARRGHARLKGHKTDVVILEVEDTGPGIPPEVQERLFAPFFSTKEYGTGLGLAISASIINKHGGLLQFRTKMNEGATFGVVLPVHRGA